jgi:Arc/MetJ family transcription regulator
MRTNIVIDDDLMAEAMKASGAATKREAVELGLKALVRLRRQAGVRAHRGRLPWRGDLEAMRTDRP